jgi:hypothetical protein
MTLSELQEVVDARGRVTVDAKKLWDYMLKVELLVIHSESSLWKDQKAKCKILRDELIADLR